MTLHTLICIVCGDPEPNGTCAGCGKPMHWECSVLSLKSGVYLACPHCREKVRAMQEDYDQKLSQASFRGEE